MKHITKLQELEATIEKIKNKKNIDHSIIEKLKFALDEEEKLSRNYLQITQNGMFFKNKKRALHWNKKVMELKEELNTIIKK